MGIPLGELFNRIDIFILIFIRMTGLFVIAPIFGRRNIPAYFKIGFSLLLALILINTIKTTKLDEYNNFLMFTLLIAKEFLVGLTLGYVSYMVFTGLYLGGQLIDMQVGFGMVNVLDPMSNIQVPITSTFYFTMCMLLFLLSNGHHFLITGLVDSYTYIQLGGAIFSENLLKDIIRNFGNIFVIGFKISAPIVAAILVTDVALGVISKSVPQVNVFVIGMPLKIIMGILIMILTFPMFAGIVDLLINGMNSELIYFLKDLGNVKT